MSAWPPIDEPILRERLAMDDATFLAFIRGVFSSLPPRPFDAGVLARALAYPWERPRSSFALGCERGQAPSTTRWPLLAIGSNGAPETLARKLEHLPEAEQAIRVQVGELEGFDVGAAAHPTAYGSMAATLFASPGAAVRCAVLWVSQAQLTQLSWTEITYRLGRLDGVTFRSDEGESVDGLLLYASRWGTFCPEGEPLALAAIPARGRTAEACTQAELLTRAAARAGLGGAEALVRALHDAPGELLASGASARIAAAGLPFTAPQWTPWRPTA